MKKGLRFGMIMLLVMFFLMVPVVSAIQDGALPIDRGSVVKDPDLKRVIADRIGGEEIKSYVSQGCKIKHFFKEAVSFDCPNDLVPVLNVRESRIFYITDLQAAQQTHVDDVWARNIYGNGVKVAILDTGVDTDHPDLVDSYLASGSYDCDHNTTIPQDDHGHGTHVAGIITADGHRYATAKGVAPASDFYMFKVCTAEGQCYEDDIFCGIERAVDTGAKVMSMSIGGGVWTTSDCDEDPLAAKINWAVGKGMIAVVAAGNNPAGVSSPGCASGAIAVGAVDSTNAVQWWSGRGPALDIVAPGVNIYSTLMGGGYGRMSGTSMATPHTAGVVALLLDANPSLTNGTIKTALYSTADKVSTCYKCSVWMGTSCIMQKTTTCTSMITGAGLVNAYGAYVQVATPEPFCSSNAECSDGLFCNGQEVCQDGSCFGGSVVGCSSFDDACNMGICDEGTDQCKKQPKPDTTPCNDENSCTEFDICYSGTCGGAWPPCGEDDDCCGPGCTAPSDPDCMALQKCWSGQYKYLFNDPYQVKKFCKCAIGIYGYLSYSSSFIKKANVYRYMDTDNNTNWVAESISSSYPIKNVLCLDMSGKLYPTNADYYR